MTDKITLNPNGTNANIKAHILSDETMRVFGFTDFVPKNWYYCKHLDEDITFNLTIPKDGSDIDIITLDENFCQPYDYQHLQEKGVEYANKIAEKVEEIMEWLHDCGIISGHKRGEYI